MTPVDLNGGGTEVDPELAHYLNRHYWTNRAAANTADSDSFLSGFSPSAPSAFYPPPPVNPDYEPSLPDTAITSSLVSVRFRHTSQPAGAAKCCSPASPTSIMVLHWMCGYLLITEVVEYEGIFGDAVTKWIEIS